MSDLRLERLLRSCLPTCDFRVPRDPNPRSHPPNLSPEIKSCSGRCRSIERAQGITALGLVKSILLAMVGHVNCQFQTTPDSQLVKCTAQMVLNHLFAGADDFADFAIGSAFPD